MHFGIDILREEHENIIRFTDALERLSLELLAGAKPVTQEHREIIAFIRGYSDGRHHDKEEKILFVEMEARLGELAERLIRQGMLVEHHQARMIVVRMEQAVEELEKEYSLLQKLYLLSATMEYVNLLRGHATRENQALFPFAEKNLPEEVLVSVDERSRAYEEEQETRKPKSEWEAWLAAFEARHPGAK